MYKNEIRIRNEKRIISSRVHSKLKKIKGNLNITKKRLTMEPGFLSLGVISETVRKNRNSDCIEEKEDLYGFLNNENLRRSARILQKNNYQNRMCLKSSQQEYNEETGLYTLTSNKQLNSDLKSKSKSVFREINQKYADIKNRNFKFISEEIYRLKNEVAPDNSDFCERFIKQICVNDKTKSLKDCKRRITEKIKKIADILSGKVDSKMFTNKKNKDNVSKSYETRDDHQVPDFEYIPEAEWMYETPPRQQITMPKIEKCNIQPAVISIADNKNIIYELKPNIKIDLTSFTNRQNVQCDKRYMTHVGTFDENNDLDDDFKMLETREQSINFCSRFELNQSQQAEAKFPIRRNLFNFKNDCFMENR